MAETTHTDPAMEAAREILGGADSGRVVAWGWERRYTADELADIIRKYMSERERRLVEASHYIDYRLSRFSPTMDGKRAFKEFRRAAYGGRDVDQDVSEFKMALAAYLES